MENFTGAFFFNDPLSHLRLSALPIAAKVSLLAAVYIMQLDVSALRFVTKDEWRVLTALELGMRNHEFVPLTLVAKIAKLRTAGMFGLLGNLMKYRLVAYEKKAYEGYRLTFLGYDYLAIHTLMSRGLIDSIGPRIGVGKEADVHVCEKNGRRFALKIHRLGRTSFRAVKSRRGYLRPGQAAHSWLYLSRLSAQREFGYLRALQTAGFPVPVGVDSNRHCLLMTFIDGTLLNKIKRLPSSDLELLKDKLFGLLTQLAQAGIVHGDFNEFNLIIGPENVVTLIDFPQLIAVTHPNAEELFDRDVSNIQQFFVRRFAYNIEEGPKFQEIVTPETLENARLNNNLVQLGDYQELEELLAQNQCTGSASDTTFSVSDVNDRDDAILSMESDGADE
eukprot:Gregarina_sp_Poly_1__10795@NODE_82_length_15568_cov_98_251403_g70_i0_p4_GENE_NODE_82_length_15568_cov_98_251403_g70_i0NODE_82_length_15568_cov_98_251403_g70_i0_p4_ORF_typecomplete_len391_score49_90RIO1/PF01163_22/8_2e48Rio2_N/PF09202_11/1_1e31Rio2_N/PF09202_11/6_9e03Kdo/PF06293_14/1_2e13WaaY/PF06176_11/1_7e10APH/PF01636_23/1_1e07Pkinase/PF00069_25/3_4e07Pkinase_fungal/PF17667_1/0_026_NODE_82_length_15568_cov_98_251403_g70_i01271513887